MFDLDRFKSINDRFGHAVGDSVLLETAKACQAGLRQTDLVGRLGGEEFGVYLTGADLDTTDQVAERIRLAISRLQFSPAGLLHPLSVSIGGATFALRADFNDLYRLADQRLYEAKHAGRDRVALMQAA